MNKSGLSFAVLAMDERLRMAMITPLLEYKKPLPSLRSSGVASFHSLYTGSDCSLSSNLALANVERFSFSL